MHRTCETIDMTSNYYNNNIIITGMNSRLRCTSSESQYNIVKSKFLMKIGLCIDNISKYRKLFIKMCEYFCSNGIILSTYLNHVKTDVISLKSSNKHQCGTLTVGWMRRKHWGITMTYYHAVKWIENVLSKFTVKLSNNQRNISLFCLTYYNNINWTVENIYPEPHILSATNYPLTLFICRFVWMCGVWVCVIISLITRLLTLLYVHFP